MHTNGLRVGNGDRYAYEHCGAIKEVLAHNMIELDHKKRGLDPQVPGLPAKWLADEVVWVTHGCAIIM